MGRLHYNDAILYTTDNSQEIYDTLTDAQYQIDFLSNDSPPRFEFMRNGYYQEVKEGDWVLESEPDVWWVMDGEMFESMVEGET